VWAKNKNTKQRLVGEKGVKLGQKVVLKSLFKSSQFEVARAPIGFPVTVCSYKKLAISKHKASFNH